MINLKNIWNAYSTQNTLVRLLQKWQNELDNSAFAGIILMDLS